MASAPVMMWFRNDLRLADHAALCAAVATKAPLIAVYVHDDDAAGEWRIGGASRWWLHHSLTSLTKSLSDLGVALVLRSGPTVEVLRDVVETTNAKAIYFTRAYDPAGRDIEARVKAAMDGSGVDLKRYGGFLLREPEEIRTQSDDVYKVYSPFWRALSNGFTPADARPKPKSITAFTSKSLRSDNLDDWQLLPSKPNWAGGLDETWSPGETGAQKRLQRFLQDALKTYSDDRNRPDRAGTSQLSPHLHFGEITPAELWRAAQSFAAKHDGVDRGLQTFLKEIVWREFSYTLLVHMPTLPNQPFRPDFSAFPWRKDKAGLEAWQRGRTGYPIVDAGMRELWHTGYMHNRVRMIVASFLIKHLLLPWQQGEAWFWDTLCDADLASNAASWQWVAGSGADAAPYFRIFNPMLQGEKFDPEGTYVRRWVPELAELPAKHIHEPWNAPDEVLKAAGVRLGDQYPKPIVDHSAARKRALAAYDVVKSQRGMAD